MSTRVLVIGATSAIAHAVARRYASRRASLFLIGRREETLSSNADDLRVRGAVAVHTARLDANDIASHDETLDRAYAAFGGFDIALVAHGVLPDQPECQASVERTLEAFDTNARSVLALLTSLANRFELQRSGAIGVISSPAADRGRASNYVYGAAKAAVSAFASGLRHRLHGAGVRVLTISPGFVDTPMTAGMQKSAIWASPERVARDVERALERGFGVVYTPGFWRWIMLVIRSLPERVFVRLRL